MEGGFEINYNTCILCGVEWNRLCYFCTVLDIHRFRTGISDRYFREKHVLTKTIPFAQLAHSLNGGHLFS